MKLTRKTNIAALSLLAVIATVGVGWAAIPAGNGTISACYSTTNGPPLSPPHSKGDTRIVDSNETCRSYEKPITWNQQGRPGPAGAPAASAFTARILQPDGTGTPYFGAVSGISTGQTRGADEVTTRSPNAPMVARDLSVRYLRGQADNIGWQVTLMVNGNPTTLTCGFRRDATTCDSGTATATVPPNSTLAFRVEDLLDPNSPFRPSIDDLEAGWRATTP